MGLREKIALVLTTLAVTQISTTQCVPSGSIMPALQRHLEARGIKSTQSLFDNVAKVTKTAPPKRSMYKAYNFPETEYPVDSSPRDPFYYGIDPVGLAEREARTQNFKAFNDMKKDMRMKRKLNMINENHQASLDPEPTWVKDKDMFPEVQYPLKSMDTWVPFYGNPTVLTQNEQRHKFSELLFEKGKRTSEPNKEDLKLKTKRLLDEINKIKEKMSSSKANSKPGTNSTELHNTKHSLTPGVRSTENLMKPDTNATQISIQKVDAVNDEGLANIIRLNSSETEDFSKQLDTANSTIVSESDDITTIVNTNFDEVSEMPMPIPYKACELRNETIIINENSNNDSKIEEPESSILLENKGNSRVHSNLKGQSIQNSTNQDSKGDNFQHVITDALIELILTHISSKNNKKNQALVSKDNDTRNCRNSDAKSALVEEELGVALLPAQNPQGQYATSNDDPLNVKLPLPGSSKDESIPTHVSIKKDTQTSDVYKATTSPIIVIPVGDSINKIQLPIVETNTGAPIIVFIPTTQKSNISASPSSNTPLALPLISEETSIHEIHNATSIKPNFETLPNNSMCHNLTQDEKMNVTQQNNDIILIEENVPTIDIVSNQENPSSVSLDHQSLIESFQNTYADEVSNDENTIAINKSPTTEVPEKPLILNDNMSDLKYNLDSKTFSASDSQKGLLLKVEDNVSYANAPTDANKETGVPSSKALGSSSLISKDYQGETISNIQDFFSDETITDKNIPITTGDAPLNNTEVAPSIVFFNEVDLKKPDDEKGIRHISVSDTPKGEQQKIKRNNTISEVNRDIEPLNKLSQIQMADVVKKNPIVLDKDLKEVNNEVLVDTPLEDKNIKSRSLSDSNNDPEMNNTLQSKPLKNDDQGADILETSILQDTLISVQTDANESPSSNTFLGNILTNVTENDPHTIKGSISNHEISQKAEEYADAITNKPEDSLKLLEKSQLFNATDSQGDLADSLLQDTSPPDKNQDLPDLGNLSSEKNEDDPDLIEDNDFFSSFDITKDGLALPKGMLICSGISEVPRNVISGSLLNNEISSSQVIKQTDANIESGEDISAIHKVLQDTPVANLSKNETIRKEEVPQYDEVTDIKKAVSNNDKTVLDTEFINMNVNSVHNDSRDVNNQTIVSENINGSKLLTHDKTNHVTDDNILLKTDIVQENLSEDSKAIQDAPTLEIINEPPKSADEIITSSSLPDLIKYLYDAV